MPFPAEAGCRCAAAALIVSLGGCHLIDQRSFGGTPHPPAPAEMAAAFASAGRLPLLVIRPDDRVPYDADLRAAIGGAEARDGDARFRLEAVVPAAGALAAQDAALLATGSPLREVLDQMGLDGVTPDRVTVSARADGTIGRQEIRLLLARETVVPDGQ